MGHTRPPALRGHPGGGPGPLPRRLRPRETEAPPSEGLPGVEAAERTLIDRDPQPFLQGVVNERSKEIATIGRHLELSLNTLIDRQNRKIAELFEIQQKEAQPLAAANLKLATDRLDELNGRLPLPPQVSSSPPRRPAEANC